MNTAVAAIFMLTFFACAAGRAVLAIKAERRRLAASIAAAQAASTEATAFLHEALVYSLADYFTTVTMSPGASRCTACWEPTPIGLVGLQCPACGRLLIDVVPEGRCTTADLAVIDGMRRNHLPLYRPTGAETLAAARGWILGGFELAPRPAAAPVLDVKAGRRPIVRRHGVVGRVIEMDEL